MTRQTRIHPDDERTRELLAHSASLRRLAHSLAGDDSAANDLVQDTMRVAIEREAPVHNLRTFLAGTMRKLAGRERRSHRRRTRREEAVARPAESPPPDAIVERLDLLQLVLAELQQLPRVQRRTLTLHFLEQLSAEQIATLDRCAVSTVRSNLARGLARIRQRLDRRFGQRHGWVALFATQLRPSSPSSAGARVALASTGAATVSSSSYLLAAVPLVLIGAWLLLSRDDPSVPGALASEQSATVEPAVATPRSESESQMPQREAAVAAPVAAQQGSRPTALVLDQHTDEPVPELALRLRADGQEQEVVTDARGVFVADRAIASGEYKVGEPVPGLIDMVSWLPDAVVHPDSPPIRVAVGPTFRLALRGAAGVAPTSLRAFLTETEGSELEGPDRLRTQVRDGDLPWVRFPYANLLRHWPEPMQLAVRDRSGYWHGKAVVNRSLGIEPNPVLVDLQPAGVARFRLEGAPGNRAVYYRVRVTRVADGHEWLRSLRSRSLPGQAADGSVMRYLRPGEYRWQVVQEDIEASGAFTIRQGETAEIPVAVASLRPTFSTEILVRDPSGSLDLEEAYSWIRDPDGKDASFHGTFVRREGQDDGSWAIRLDDVPEHDWLVRLGQGLGRFRFEPRDLRVGPHTPPPMITVYDRGELQPVTVTVVDKQTGEILPFGTLSYWVDGDGIGPGNAARGKPIRIQVPGKEPVRMFGWAPGYRMLRRDCVVERDGNEVRFELERGWGTCVRVWHEGDRVADAEVWIDGRLAGRTDTFGTLVVAADEVPGSVEVKAAGYVMEGSGKPGKDLSKLSAFGLNLQLERP